MKRILLATIAALSLGACGSTGSVVSHTDKFTGEKIVTANAPCSRSTNLDKFCLTFTTYEQSDSGSVLFSYFGDDWLFMDMAQAKIVDTGQTITLFNVDPFDVSRDIISSGNVSEQWSYSFKLSTSAQDKSGVAQFVRAVKANPNSKVMFRVSGSGGVADFY